MEPNVNATELNNQLVIERERIQNVFGANIRKKRKQLNLTQEILAERIGVDAETVTSLENGRVWIGLDNLVKLSIVLEIPVYAFFIDYERDSIVPVSEVTAFFEDAQERFKQTISENISSAKSANYTQRHRRQTRSHTDKKRSNKISPKDESRLHHSD